MLLTLPNNTTKKPLILMNYMSLSWYNVKELVIFNSQHFTLLLGALLVSCDKFFSAI